jgi:hypothetical protein
MRTIPGNRWFLRFVMLFMLALAGVVSSPTGGAAQDPPGPDCGETWVFYYDEEMTQYAGHMTREPYEPESYCYCRRYQTGVLFTDYWSTIPNPDC